MKRQSNIFSFDYKPSGERAFRKNGRKHIANPVATVFSNENYDLICYHDNHKKITSDRIDRMADIKKESALIDKSNQPKDLDISARRKQAFYRFGGAATGVGLKPTRIR